MNLEVTRKKKNLEVDILVFFLFHYPLFLLLRVQFFLHGVLIRLVI